MAIDSHAPVLEPTDDWLTDFGSSLDDISIPEFSNPWNLSKTTELDDIFNHSPDSVHDVHDLSYFTTNSSVADACYELPHENFDAHTQHLNRNQSASLDSHHYGSIFPQRSASSVPHYLVVSDLDRTARHTLKQADIVRQNDVANGSRLINTIDDAESNTVMEVMRVLVASKAEVNFQNA